MHRIDGRCIYEHSCGMWERLRRFNPKPRKAGERRGVPRYGLEIPLTVTTAAGKVCQGFSRDMSDGGMGAVLSSEIALGEQVVLQYQLPDGSQPKKRAAKVRWRDGSRYGFQFLEQYHGVSRVTERATP